MRSLFRKKAKAKMIEKVQRMKEEHMKKCLFPAPKTTKNQKVHQ